MSVHDTNADDSTDSQSPSSVADKYQGIDAVKAFSELQRSTDWDRVAVPVTTPDDACVTTPKNSSLFAAFSQWLSPGITIHALLYEDTAGVVFVAPDESGFCTACNDNDSVELHKEMTPAEAQNKRRESNCVHATHAKHTGTVGQCSECGSWRYSERFAPQEATGANNPYESVSDLHVRYCLECETEHEWF
jgi:hypothetical protein